MLNVIGIEGGGSAIPKFLLYIVVWVLHFSPSIPMVFRQSRRHTWFHQGKRGAPTYVAKHDVIAFSGSLIHPPVYIIVEQGATKESPLTVVSNFVRGSLIC